MKILIGFLSFFVCINFIGNENKLPIYSVVNRSISQIVLFRRPFGLSDSTAVVVPWKKPAATSKHIEKPKLAVFLKKDDTEDGIWSVVELWDDPCTNMDDSHEKTSLISLVMTLMTTFG